MTTMLISWQKCCILGVISLFFMQCACVSGPEDAQRLMKQSYWDPVERDSIGASKWEGLDTDEDVLQPEDQVYGEDLDKAQSEDEYLMDSEPDSGIQGYRLSRNILRGRGAHDGTQDMFLRNSFLKRGHGPRGFYGSRGKRFVPGMEALLLARIYEAMTRHNEKIKRQPHPGYHASRG